MKDTSILEKEDLEEEDSLPSVSNSIGSAEETILSKEILQNKEHNPIVFLSILNDNSWNKQRFFQEIYCLENSIPKHIIGFDEKYLRSCLEWIHVSAFGAVPCNFSSKLGISRTYSGSTGFSPRSTDYVLSPAMECPLTLVSDSVVAADSSGGHILGTISSSKSMMNILNSPLLNRLGVLEPAIVGGGGGLLEVKEAIAADFITSPGNYVNKPGKLKEVVLGDHVSEPVHKRFASMSSTNSTCSDQSSSSTSTAVSQGMLQCTWKDGCPHYLFSIDDHGEVYAANLFNIRSADDKALDYVYTFHLKSARRRELENRDMELDLVAKMKVSTSVTLCPKNSEIVETQFVLFGSSESWSHEQNSVQTSKKNKRLVKKVADVFRAPQTLKQRRSSKNLGTSVILEDTSWESSDNACDILDHGPVNPLDADTPPNLELAAVVVKDHVCRKPKEPEIGGWGLKFLKKSGNIKSETASEDSSSVSECCQRDNGECSTSMNVLLPAGYHGGPRTRKGGPSSLLERWRSGGHCDCGGWDMGCPLTVMNSRTNRMEGIPLTTDSGECKTVDLFVEGTQQSGPMMKMTNIHEDLYYIHFQSTLSALQTFSIAAAIIHSHSPTLRPKLYSG